MLGAVFLCTTGAEVIYADLGRCGRKNIQVSWIFVKIALLLNYFGQGAWLMRNIESGHGCESLLWNNAGMVSDAGNNFGHSSFNNCKPVNYKRIIYPDG